MLDGGDPLERLDDFSVAGEVAVIDLDAAMGVGSNRELIARMVRRAPCRVGGGIRDLDTARWWLDQGAVKIIIGTAATPDFCAQLPRDRLIAAVDARHGQVVVNGWQSDTGDGVIDRVRRLAPFVSGFLFTQVDREGEMGGFDEQAVFAVVEAAGQARVTAAGGIVSPDDIARLDELGADAQVGMALYTGALDLGEAIAGCLRKPVDGDTWPTVVTDEFGRSLGLTWSTRETVATAVRRRRGVYWSRSRQETWEKGLTSGAAQDLLRVELDCDRDALRFTVRQHGSGFCHLGTRTCWGGEKFGLADLERVIHARMREGDEASGVVKLATRPELLHAKLREEVEELIDASNASDVVHEVADVLFFAMVSLANSGAGLDEVLAELRRRHARATRRPLEEKAA